MTTFVVLMVLLGVLVMLAAGASVLWFVLGLVFKAVLFAAELVLAVGGWMLGLAGAVLLAVLFAPAVAVVALGVLVVAAMCRGRRKRPVEDWESRLARLERRSARMAGGHGGW